MQLVTGGERMRFKEIRTGRLVLRDLEVADAQRIFAYRSHPEVSRFQSWGTQSADEIRPSVNALSKIGLGTPGSWYQVGIALCRDGELIGDCGFRVLETEPRQAEFGITLDLAYQHQGYAAEAVRALLDYLFFTLGKHRVFGSVDPRNRQSIQLMERVGLREEAHFVQSLWFKGEWVDDVIFATLASEWKTRDNESS